MTDPLWLLPILFLLIQSLHDCRSRTISLRLTAVVAAAGLLFLIIRQPVASEVLLRLLPGFVLLSAGLLSRGGIGTGDGLVLLTAGLCLPSDAAIAGTGLALFLSALLGAVLLIRRRSRNTAFPFVPFLLVGCLISLLFRVLSG